MIVACCVLWIVGAITALAGLVVDRVSVTLTGMAIAAVAMGLAFAMVPSP